MSIEMPRAQVAERTARGLPGWPVLGGVIVAVVAALVLIAKASGVPHGLGIALLLLAFLTSVGLTPVAPGQARVVQLLGRYAGTIRTDGLRWVNPLTTRRRISTRIRN